jgi:hypothetical protein
MPYTHRAKHRAKPTIQGAKCIRSHSEKVYFITMLPNFYVIVVLALIPVQISHFVPMWINESSNEKYHYFTHSALDTPKPIFSLL